MHLTLLILGTAIAVKHAETECVDGECPMQLMHSGSSLAEVAASRMSQLKAKGLDMTVAEFDEYKTLLSDEPTATSQLIRKVQNNALKDRMCGWSKSKPAIATPPQPATANFLEIDMAAMGDAIGTAEVLPGLYVLSMHFGQFQEELIKAAGGLVQRGQLTDASLCEQLCGTIEGEGCEVRGEKLLVARVRYGDSLLLYGADKPTKDGDQGDNALSFDEATHFSTRI